MDTTHSDTKKKLNGELEARELSGLENNESAPLSVEEARENANKEIKNEVTSFKEGDSKIEEIESSVSLDDPSLKERIKEELRVKEILSELDAELLAYAREATLKLEEINKSEINVDNEELIEEDTLEKEINEKYKKEILPIIEIMRPDEIDPVEFETAVKDELFEAVKKIQVGQGKLMENPENTLNDVKKLLHSRIKSIIEDSNDYSLKIRPDEKSVRSAKIALLVEGDKSDFEKYFGGKEKVSQKKFEMYDLRHYIGNRITKRELDGLAKTPLIYDLIASNQTDFYHDRPEGIPESVLTIAANLATEQKSNYFIVEIALERAEKGEFSKETSDLLLEKGHGKYILEFLDKFKEVDIEKIAQSSLFERDARDSLSAITHNKNISEEVKNKLRERGIKKYLSSGRFYGFTETIKESNLPEEKLVSSENQELGLEGIKKYLSLGNTYETFNAIEVLKIPEDKLGSPEMQEAAVNGIQQRLRAFGQDTGASHDVEKIMQKFKINKDVFNEAIFQAIPDLAINLDPRNFMYLVNTYNIPLEKIDTPKLQEKFYEGFQEAVARLDFYEVEKMSNSLSVFPFLKEKFANKSPYDIIFEAKIEETEKSETHLNKEIKIKRLKNIQESFKVSNNIETLPPRIRESLEKFEDKYGPKGKNLGTLAIVAYGTENPENFEREMERMEKVLDKYNPTAIPEGADVSMGIEYEVTSSIASDYVKESSLGYKTDIQLISKSANIGKGTGGVHEIATRPTYNPYILMAEVKLMQDAALFDMNFQKYTQAPRGYHMSLVGDSGLEAHSRNLYFLNNLLTMTELTGVLAGKEIVNTKDIYSKSFDNFSKKTQKGDRCEMKGMACDTVEQFEKAVITTHNAGVAIQICNKYIIDNIPGKLFDKNTTSSEQFEQKLISIGALTRAFESDQERNIAYEWMKLKYGIMEAIDNHNDHFVDSEFNGGFLDEEDSYIDTSDHIDTVRNKNLVSEEEINSGSLSRKLHLDRESIFMVQSPDFVNKLVEINNIFLKDPIFLKGPQENDISSINAKAVLDVSKYENYAGIVEGRPQESIFERGGEFRDGYYYVQGASEEMITHKSQILLNHFNKEMETLLQTKGEKRMVEEVQRSEAV